MEGRGRVVCPKNETLVDYLLQKKRAGGEPQRVVGEPRFDPLNKALFNIAGSTTDVTSLKELSQVKGVGKWVLRLIRGFFQEDKISSQTEDKDGKGKEAKDTKRYLPKKNSIAYSMLITLYRESLFGQEYMRKQELIDSAKASVLSRVPIANLRDEQSKFLKHCPIFDDFVKSCQEAEKMTMNDVFAMQLMQDGDACAQEEMLCKQSNDLFNPVASKNIFRLVWGD